MWMKGTCDKFLFDRPMVWQEPRDHSSNCYFCMVKTSGYNKKNKCKTEYPILPSAICPVPHLAEIPVPVFKELPCFEIKGYESGEDQSDTDDEDFEIEDDSVRKGFEQYELNELARDFGLSKKASELQPIMQLNGNCSSIAQVCPPQWKHIWCSTNRLFSLREDYEDIKRVIDLLQYHMHQWIICVDLKMV